MAMSSMSATESARMVQILKVSPSLMRSVIRRLHTVDLIGSSVQIDLISFTESNMEFAALMLWCELDMIEHSLRFLPLKLDYFKKFVEGYIAMCKGYAAANENFKEMWPDRTIPDWQL